MIDLLKRVSDCAITPCHFNAYRKRSRRLGTCFAKSRNAGPVLQPRAGLISRARTASQRYPHGAHYGLGIAHYRKRNCIQIYLLLISDPGTRICLVYDPCDKRNIQTYTKMIWIFNRKERTMNWI